jgi:hypothetical protein
MKTICSLFILLLFNFSLFAQTEKEKEIQGILQSNPTSMNDTGMHLIQNGQYEQANNYFSSSINRDGSDRTAYFQRGVSNWALSDTLNACRDWSAVLALGDTEMYNLLESKCHSTMIIGNDSIPAKQYKKIFATDEGKSAKSVVEVMPAFPGGQENLMKYLGEKTPKLQDGQRGTVYVIFTVSPKGKILYPYVKHGLGGRYDKAAIQLVKNMPAWTPGKQKGKAVYVKSGLPIRFS